MVGKVAFLLGTPNNTTSAIFVRVPYGVPQRIGTKLKYNYLKYSIGESVNPAYWNKNNFRAKETLKFPEHSEFNTRLNNIESMIRATLLFFKNQDIVPTKEELKAELDNRIKPTEVVPEVVIPGVKTIEVDKAERLLIPKDLKTFANLQKEIVISGVGEFFEIWDKESYEQNIAISETDFATISEEVMGSIDFNEE